MQELNRTRTTPREEEPGQEPGGAPAGAGLAAARRDLDSLYATASAAMERVRGTDSEALLRRVAQSGGQ